MEKDNKKLRDAGLDRLYPPRTDPATIGLEELDIFLLLIITSTIYFFTNLLFILIFTFDVIRRRLVLGDDRK